MSAILGVDDLLANANQLNATDYSQSFQLAEFADTLK
jgi:hypothetical protein